MNTIRIDAEWIRRRRLYFRHGGANGAGSCTLSDSVLKHLPAIERQPKSTSKEQNYKKNGQSKRELHKALAVLARLATS